MCQVLAAVLCIGDIKIEEDLSNYHLGEISLISNPMHVMVGKCIACYTSCSRVLTIYKFVMCPFCESLLLLS